MTNEAERDYCERCGEAAPGRYQVMFYHSLFRLPAREFYCFRCIRLMRLYAVAGFSILGFGIIIVTLLLVFY